MVMLLMVLMADMPSAPAKQAEEPMSEIWAMLGVILGMTGMRTLRLTAAVKKTTSSESCPTSLPMPAWRICGQEKLSSTASQPAASARLASSIHSSSSRPMMEAMTTLEG